MFPLTVRVANGWHVAPSTTMSVTSCAEVTTSLTLQICLRHNAQHNRLTSLGLGGEYYLRLVTLF